MSDILDFTTVTPLSADGQVVAHGGFVVQDNIPTLEENYIARMNANNGFSKQRLFRKIGSVPILAAMEARRQGYNMDNDKDVYRFLNENPGYRTVDAIDTGRSPNIIIK